MSTNYIIAIDPGHTTGIVYYCTQRENVVLNAEIEGRDRAIDMVANTIESQPQTIRAIVAEAFVFTEETTRVSPQYDPLKINGAVEWLCARYGVRYVEQHRDRQSFGTKAKLQKLGWWFPGDGHSRSAAKHLLAFLDDHRLMNPERYYVEVA